MKRMLINATQPDEVRVTITENSLVMDYDVEFPGQEEKKSNIYKGRITSIEPSLGAVFVDYGSERHGFLPVKEISPEYFLNKEEGRKDHPDVHKILKLGQELLIQIEKEERGNKGAALTTFISLAGSFLVLMPNNPRAGGISRRIDGEDRDQLRESLGQLQVPEGMGTIIRTAGVGKTGEELQWDLSVLLQYWEAIQQAAASKSAPYLIHQEGDVIIRAIRDYLRHDTAEIIIDEANAYERAKNYIGRVRPNLLDRVKFYSDHLPLFSRFQVEQQIETAYQHEVRLPSGGSIVIDVTEALVAIDINSSRATKGADIEETALNTNIEAAEEIARQLRLRDIGGLIVIDFIDMTPVRNQRDVENRLRNALHIDRARIQVGRISRFGLLEMSRQRLRSSLNRSSQVLCPRCTGQGSIRSVESTALSIVHLIQEKAATSKNLLLQVQVPVDIATFLLNEKRNVLKEIDQQSDMKVTIIPNQNLESPQYLIKQSKYDPLTYTGSDIPSYATAKVAKADSESYKKVAPAELPAITEFLTTESTIPSTPPQKSIASGLIQKIRDMLFGGKSSSAKKYKKPLHDEQPARKHHEDSRSHDRRPSRSRPHSHSRDDTQPRKHHADRDEGREGSHDKPRSRPEGRHESRHDGSKRPDHRGGNRRGSRGGQQRERQFEPHGDIEHSTPPKQPEVQASALHVERPPVPQPMVSAPAQPKVHVSVSVDKVTPPPVHATPVIAPAVTPKAEPESKPAEEKKIVTAPASQYSSNAPTLGTQKPLHQITTKNVKKPDSDNSGNSGSDQ